MADATHSEIRAGLLCTGWKMSAAPEEIIKPLKLDLGCGKNKKEGFLGVDSRPFDGVDIVLDICGGNAIHDIETGDLASLVRAPKTFKKWPWADNSVDEVHCSHMLEHLKPKERIHFANELWRVLKVGSKAAITTPHYASVRAYGDLTHEWPPVVTFWYLYLNKEWRTNNAPHNDEYVCDFDHGYGFGLHPTVQTRNQDYQNYAVVHLLEGAQDLFVTLIKRA